MVCSIFCCLLEYLEDKRNDCRIEVFSLIHLPINDIVLADYLQWYSVGRLKSLSVDRCIFVCSYIVKNRSHEIFSPVPASCRHNPCACTYIKLNSYSNARHFFNHSSNELQRYPFGRGAIAQDKMLMQSIFRKGIV